MNAKRMAAITVAVLLMLAAGGCGDDGAPTDTGTGTITGFSVVKFATEMSLFLPSSTNTPVTVSVVSVRLL